MAFFLLLRKDLNDPSLLLVVKKIKLAIGRKMDGLFTDHDTQDLNPNPRQFLSDTPPSDDAYHGP